MCPLSVRCFEDNVYNQQQQQQQQQQNTHTHTHTQNDLKEIIWIASSIISSQELQAVFNNIHQMSIKLSVVGSLHMPALTCGKLHYIIRAVNVHYMSRFHFKMDIL